MLKKIIEWLKFKNLPKWAQILIWIAIGTTITTTIGVGCAIWGPDFISYLTKILGLASALI